MTEYRGYNPESAVEPSPEKENLGDSSEVRWLRETHPVFEGVDFAAINEPAFEGGRFSLPTGDGGRPVVSIAAGGAERYVRLKESRKEGVEAMASELGRSFEEMTGDDIRQFILFHEAGHARDFLENFHDAADGADFSAASADWRANSVVQLQSLPFPDASPAELRAEIAAAGSFEAWASGDPQNGKWCRERDITNERELLRIQEKAYRALDKERYADKFAVRMVRELAEKTDPAK